MTKKVVIIILSSKSWSTFANNHILDTFIVSAAKYMILGEMHMDDTEYQRTLAAGLNQ